MGVIAASADQPLLDVEAGDAGLAEKRDQPFDLGHDFGADTVAGKKEKLVICHNGNLRNDGHDS